MLPLSLLATANTETGKRGKTDPVIAGMVSDASSKKPVQGVTVSISSANKNIDKDRKEVLTDAAGNFKVPDLPPGEVVIVLTKKGYKTSRKENVVIKEGVALKLNFDITEEDESDVFHPLMRMMDGD